MSKTLGQPRLWMLIIFSLIGSINIKAQEFEWTSNDFPGSRFLGIYEVNDKLYGIASNGALQYYHPDINYQLSVYEIEFEKFGEPGLFLTEIKTKPFTDNFATIAIDYVSANDVWIMVQSSVITEGFQSYRVLLCNEDFEIIAQQSIDTAGYPIPFFIDSYNGRTIILGSIVGPPRNEILFLPYDHYNPHYLPPITITQSNPESLSWVTSMCIEKETDNLLIFYYDGVTILDDSLNQILDLSISEILTGYHGNVKDFGSNYYSHGARRQSWQTGFRWLVFHKYDSLFNIQFADTFGIEGQDNYPFQVKSLDIRNNEFLVGGHLDGPFSHIDFNRSIKKFYLAKYDIDMNQLWYKEFGGDKAYNLFGLRLLADSSSLAYGGITDTVSGIRFAYIMHLDKDGDIISSSEMPVSNSSITILNPGNSVMQVLNPESLDARIILYDLKGNVILQYDLGGSLNEILTESLPPTIYPYVIISDGQYLASGKWVKSN